jgi:riboflavin synthase
MFTGIVAATGKIAEIELHEGEGRFRFATGKLLLAGVRLGDSIAVNGACLTVVELHAGGNLENGFSADVSRETIDCTTLGDRAVGDGINLEKALTLGEALGGHMVTGHVDGVGVVVALTPDGESLRLSIEAPEQLARYIAAKGSVCVDGTSLTVNRVDGGVFELMIVPHTQSETIIAGYQQGTRVNIEVDIIARYLERLMQHVPAE